MMSMFKDLPPVYKGILLALTGYTGFAFSDTCTKFLVARYPLTQVIAIENAVAALLLLAFAEHLGKTKSLFKKKNLKIHGLRAVLNVCLNFILAFCFMKFSLAAVYTMVFTKPFFAALLALPLYGEKISGTRALAIIAGFAGVLIVLQPGAQNFDAALILPMIAAFAAALMFVCARSLDKPSLFSLGFIPMAGVAVVATPFMLFNFVMPDIRHIPIFAVSGICMGLGLICVSRAFRKAPASVVAPIMYTEMIWALAFGLLIFGDLPDIWMLAGAFVIIASGVHLVETERRNVKRQQSAI